MCDYVDVDFTDYVSYLGEVEFSGRLYESYEVVLPEYLVRVSTYRYNGEVRVLPGSVMYFDTVTIDWLSVDVEDGSLRDCISSLVSGYLLSSVED